jgi:hypothetical protein
MISAPDDLSAMKAQTVCLTKRLTRPGNEPRRQLRDRLAAHRSVLRKAS